MRQTVAVLTSEPLSAVGGVEHVLRELVKGLELRGYDVLVLHRENSAPQWLKHPHNRIVKSFGDFVLSLYLGSKLRSFQDCEFAAVISNGPTGWYIPKLKVNGKPIRKLHMYHGTYRQQAEAIRPFIKYQGYQKLKWWDSMVLERASGRGKRILCNSDQTRDEVHRFFGLRGITTWLPLDTSRFRPMDQSECRKQLGLAETGPIGIFVGSPHPMKGFQIVQKLMQSLPDVRWLLALRGSIPTGLADDPRVRVFADVPHDDLPMLYNAADFAVFPSRYEPFGYVVAEALACGTPVIAAPGGASKLFLQDPPLDSLFITDAAEPEHYIAAIRDVLVNAAAYRNAVITNARPKVVQTMAPENWWPGFLRSTGL